MEINLRSFTGGTHSIKGFNFSGTQMGNTGAKALALKLQSNHTSQLTHIDISNNQITSKGALAIAPALITPIPDSGSLGDQSIPYNLQWALHNATANTPLKTIDLSYNNITATGGRSICRAATVANLYPPQVNLQGNPIDAGLLNFETCTLSSPASRLQPPRIFTPFIMAHQFYTSLLSNDFLKVLKLTVTDYVSGLDKWHLLNVSAATLLAFRQEIYQALVKRLPKTVATDLNNWLEQKKVVFLNEIIVFAIRQKLDTRSAVLHAVMTQSKQRYWQTKQRETMHRSNPQAAQIKINNNQRQPCSPLILAIVGLSLLASFSEVVSENPIAFISLLPLLLSIPNIVSRAKEGYQRPDSTGKWTSGFFAGVEAVAESAPGSSLLKEYWEKPENDKKNREPDIGQASGSSDFKQNNRTGK